MENFKVGDVVALKSGSPTMTIHSIEDGNSLNCVYFLDGKPEYFNLNAEVFELISKESKQNFNGIFH